jgi:hypothetical protein
MTLFMTPSPPLTLLVTVAPKVIPTDWQASLRRNGAETK